MIRPNLQRIFICAGIAILLCGLRSPAQTSGEGHIHEIQVTAKKFEFTPSVITVEKGERVKLTITALDREHGFALPAFGIQERLPKGVPTVIEFDANKTGVFPFHCSVFCGLGHHRMKGTLVVKAD